MTWVHWVHKTHTHIHTQYLYGRFKTYIVLPDVTGHFGPCFCYIFFFKKRACPYNIICKDQTIIYMTRVSYRYIVLYIYILYIYNTYAYIYNTHLYIYKYNSIYYNAVIFTIWWYSEMRAEKSLKHGYLLRS